MISITDSLSSLECTQDPDVIALESLNSAIPASPYAAEIKDARSLVAPPLSELKSKEVRLGPKTHKHTLVLDIDNTLVFTTVCPKLKTGVIQYMITSRPYTDELLEKMSLSYEIVLFTAGNEEYAETIRNYLDPEGRLIKKAIGGEHCVNTQEGYYVKDLRIFTDRQLSDIIIVDDRIVSFAFQLENGVPVTSFDGVKDDEELKLLIDYLELIKDEPDIRRANKEKIALVSA